MAINQQKSDGCFEPQVHRRTTKSHVHLCDEQLNVGRVFYRIHVSLKFSICLFQIPFWGVEIQANSLIPFGRRTCPNASFIKVGIFFQIVCFGINALTFFDF